ncbi:MAG TPA: AraC family transcriptional regulator [Gemmatimonadaceae bacterium]|nr:AraC family transcriptional regulator [Gemmatimonadaceae bacterium]
MIAGGGGLPSVVVHVARDRTRALVREAFPRRRWRVIVTRTAKEMDGVFRRELVDAALVDVGAPDDEAWGAASLALEFPSAPFFALLPLRPQDTPAAARCMKLGFTDFIADGLDDGAARDIVMPQTFTTRFRDALTVPPPSLALATPLQRSAWSAIVAHGGRPVTTTFLAAAVNLSREHLSRNFSLPGAPNLKRVIDLVRLIAAAELAKNPGHDIRDVARVLGFASSSHLAVTAQRILGSRPASLARLRTVDLIDRFAQGRTRSRT